MSCLLKQENNEQGSKHIQTNNYTSKQIMEAHPHSASPGATPSSWAAFASGIRKGTSGVSTNGVTANLMCFDSGTFFGTPVNLLLSSQKCQGVPVPQSVKLGCFCSRPISVDPICPQPRHGGHGGPPVRLGGHAAGPWAGLETCACVYVCM